MLLPFLTPAAPAAFVHLDTCPALPAGQQTIPRPQPGAKAFSCPHPCPVAGTSGCRFHAPPMPAPARVGHVYAFLRLAATQAELLEAATPDGEGRGGGGGRQSQLPAVLGTTWTVPVAERVTRLVSIAAGTLSGRLGCN